jgi:hypothetical protein
VFSTKPIVSRCSASGPGQEGLLSNEKGSIFYGCPVPSVCQHKTYLSEKKLV